MLTARAADAEDEDLDAQWKRLGADPQAARDAACSSADAEEPDADFELWPEFREAWECFVMTWSNWRIVVGASALHYEGIDRAAIGATLQMLGVPRHRQRSALMHLLVLEDEARRMRNAQRG